LDTSPAGAISHLLSDKRAAGAISCLLWCQELTTLWVARLDYSAELKVADPKEQQRDIEEEETEGKERQD